LEVRHEGRKAVDMEKAVKSVNIEISLYVIRFCTEVRFSKISPCILFPIEFRVSQDSLHKGTLLLRSDLRGALKPCYPVYKNFIHKIKKEKEKQIKRNSNS